MEWALAVPSIQAGSTTNMNDIKEVFEERFGNISFTRLYYGQEFCEKAICSKETMKRAFTYSEEKGMRFTYVTPYVTERGLSKLKNRLLQLAKEKPGSEVVINDWGVLDWLYEQQLTLVPILGRLLNKVLRDPRMPKALINSVNSKPMNHFRTSYLAGDAMKNLLNQYNVRRIELDQPPQGLDPELSNWGYQTSLYLPFGVVTTGRICLIQSWGLEEKEKFKPSRDCDQKCRHFWLEISDLSGQVRKNSDWKLMQKGNTVFYRQSKSFVAKALEQAERTGVNRIIFQPEPL